MLRRAALAARPPGLKYARLIPSTPVETAVVRSISAVRRNSSNSAYRPTQTLELTAAGCGAAGAGTPGGGCWRDATTEVADAQPTANRASHRMRRILHL